MLLACVRLRLFEILADGPRTSAELARAAGLAGGRHGAPAARRRVAASGGRAATTARAGPLGAALLGNPGVRRMVEHHALLYADLRDPVALLRGEQCGTELSRYWPYAGGRAARGTARLSRSRPTAR